MRQGEILLYVVLPYAAIAVFVLGHIWRYRRDQYGWGARSTQLLESRWLRWASVIFHVGVLAVIAGHVVGVLIPISWTRAVGLSDDAYHVLAVAGGLVAGAAISVGFVLLVLRRIRFPRVRATTTHSDVVVFALLAVAIATGMLATITNIGDAVHYRENVSPYFRQIFILNPQPELMTGGGVTFIFQLHVISAWFLIAFWPFSRLVHAWSIPIDYFRRSPVPYRSQRGHPRRAAPRPAAHPAARARAGSGTADRG